jgi:hypothetical protein
MRHRRKLNCSCWVRFTPRNHSPMPPDAIARASTTSCTMHLRPEIVELFGVGGSKHCAVLLID